jgi:hypothetical protein
MTPKIRITIGSAALAAAILLLPIAGAQQRVAQQRVAKVASRPTAYDATRETILQGTVVSYTENSPRAPLGAHVTVQTVTGTVDVHLGPASYLRSNHFSFAAGESVRLVGVSVATKGGDVFLARTAQRGAQAIAVRSPHGFLLANSRARSLPPTERAANAQQRKPR